jgi:hypothetical protein
MLSFGE